MESLKKEKIKEFLVGFTVFLIISVSFYLYVFRKYTPIYGINDDWTLYMVISGSYLGYPEPHVNYMMYPLSRFLCKLYSLTSSIPWYGILLQGSIALCGFFLFFRICNLGEKGIKRILFSSLSLMFFLCSHIGIILLIQYTLVGAVCAATAIFLFLTADTKGKNGKEYLIKNIPTIIMAILSLNIRENTLYMALPVAGMVLIAKWYIEDRKITKDVITRYAGLVFVLGVFLGGTVITHKIAYSSPEWKQYVEVNNARTKGGDYYGFPDYKEVEDILIENGMTKEDYEICLSYLTFYRGEMDYSDFLTAIADVAKEKYDGDHTFSVRLENANNAIRDSFTIEGIKPLNLVVFWLFVVIVLGMICSRNRKAVFPFLCYLFGRFFAWYYLLFAGRFPERIPQGLFSIDFMTLLGFAIYFRIWENVGFVKHKTVKAIGSSVIAILFALVLYDGFYVMDKLTGHVDTYQERWYGIKKYCQENLENRYFLSSGSQTILYYSDDIFETNDIGKKQNFYCNSNFDSPSPNFYTMLGAEYGSYLGDDMIEQNNNYWIYEKGCFSEEVRIVKFYQKEYSDFSYELVDVFEAGGTNFEVYRFSK